MELARLAVAAFEDMALKRAMSSVRSNQRNVKNLARASSSSKNAVEFERWPKEIQSLPRRGEPS